MKALITGVTGQDGSYLAESLLQDGMIVYGLMRRSSVDNTTRIAHLLDHDCFRVVRGDLTDALSIYRVVDETRPDEVYNLGAMSHVRISFDQPSYTYDTITTGTLNLLEAIRRFAPQAHFYQASSSEMFGRVLETPQRETTPFNPRSPYGCAKAAAHYQTVNYREAYHLHASCGILFNHESPRRGENFVTRKITKAVAEIVAGKRDKFALGNLQARRDWGYAKEYVEAMKLMIRASSPDDYVIATGETHTVEEFLDAAFKFVNKKWQDHVVIDPALFRPTEVDLLLGDATKARLKLGWKPETTFKRLVELMVEEDLERYYGA